MGGDVPCRLALFLLIAPAVVLAQERDVIDDFVRWMNLGKAFLENRDADKAIEALTSAVEAAPDSAAAWRNLARAHLLARKPAEARVALEKAAAIEPESAATAYLHGLTYVRESEFAAAVPQFEKAARLDPDTAAVRFQLANAYQATGQHDKAKTQLHETIRLDPRHASAHFKLSVYARQAGDREEFQRRTREFIRLRELFGDASRTAEALELCRHTQPEGLEPPAGVQRLAKARRIDVRFSDQTAEALGQVEDLRARAAAVLDVDPDGRVTLVLAGDGQLSLLGWQDGTFRHKKADVEGSVMADPRRCLVGDYHNDVPEGERYDCEKHAFNDVLLIGQSGVQLLKQRPDGAFVDRTEKSGLKDVAATHAVWADYEHDGDLDILFATDKGPRLWQNNGDETFQDVTAGVGIGSTDAPADLFAADLEKDQAVDLLVARGEEPTLVFQNQRAGRFKPMPQPPGPWPAANRVLADDLDNDGRPDAILMRGDSFVTLWTGGATRSTTTAGVAEVRAAVLFDYDNDGWLDLCVAGRAPGDAARGAIHLFRQRADGAKPEWEDVSKETGLDGLTMDVATLIPFDADGDGDTDLLTIAPAGRLHWLRNDGGHVNEQLKLRLGTIKTNPTGLGTHLEVRDGDFWITRTVSRVPIELGVGDRKKLEAVQTLWSNGVVDNQIDVAVPDKPLLIIEKNVATGSCPFLYAWDGTGFRFVTDILGNAPIGLPVARNVMLPADTDEVVYVGTGEDFVPRDSQYTLQVTEEFCEVLYLDAARLIAVDHPPETEVHPTDKLMPDPFPPSEVWALKRVRATERRSHAGARGRNDEGRSDHSGSRAPVPDASVTESQRSDREDSARLSEERSTLAPLRAVGDDGIDRTKALQAIDGHYAPPGPLLPPPFRGSCYPMALTMDFGPVNQGRPLVLAMTGWLRYGQASANIAISQSAAHEVIPPRLEVYAAQGWQPIDVVVGMPAGKTKTILVDLTEKLPAGRVEQAGDLRLRLTTTFEIRWDRIALFERADLPASRIHEIDPTNARVHWRGFSPMRVFAPGHPDVPDVSVIRDRPSWTMCMEGWCTRYGDAVDLVRTIDNRLAIINAGDAITLNFDATALPPVQDGLQRSYFFYSYGWEKDCDPNVTDGTTVGPLPVPESQTDKHGDVPGDDWRLKYNTRFVPRDRFSPPK